MGEVIFLSQDTAAAMTTFKELSKMYRKRDPIKFRDAIDIQDGRYKTLMDEVLGR